MLRNIRRNVAKVNMRKNGLTKFCKHDHSQGYTLSGKKGEVTYVNSYFAKHWKEYV